MIYLKIKDNIVEMIHYMPFDETHGLNQTKEELEKTGLLVNELPIKPEELVGKDLFLYANPLRWEYVDRPLTREEKLQQMVIDGRITQEEMNELL